MTSTADRTVDRPLIEADRWADITPIRRGPRARLSAAIAERIVRRGPARPALRVLTGPR